MLKDKDTIWHQEFMIHNQVWKICYPAQIIGWIGKNYIVFGLAGHQEAFYICPGCPYLIETKFINCFQDECKIFVMVFYKVDNRTITGGKFITYASCTGKKIQNSTGCDIVMVSNNIKKALFRQICSRPGSESFWRMNNFSPVFPAYYSQV